MVRSNRSERGFTLIELMVVVALIGILAAVVVPGFFRESRKAKTETEVSAMFAELQMRLEQYKQDNNVYLAAAACPTTTTPAGSPASACTTSGSPWALMRVSPTHTTLRCSYEIVAGTAATTASNPNGFTFTSPAMNWYYILATCDSDGVTTKNSQFFTNSVNSQIQTKDLGH